MNTILVVALSLFFGIIFNRITKFLHLPNVTGYLIAGLLIGPFCLNIIDKFSLSSLEFITTISLGFIAFAIGEEFKLDSIKKIGKNIITITIFQALFAVIFVWIGLFAVYFIFPDQVTIPMILILGAIATATAPAATLLVVKQYKAKGIVTNTLLPVVALDDAMGLIIFSLCVAIAKSFVTANSTSIILTIIIAFLEVIASLAIGGIIGFLLSLANKYIKDNTLQFIITIFCILIGIGICEINMEFELSSLLVCMSIGAVYVNFNKQSKRTFKMIEHWTSPLYMLFFILSGATLNLAIIPYIGLVGVVYLLMRSFGKISGAYLGSKIVNADKNVTKYLGFTLLPQAGVAIGMANLIAEQAEFSAFSQTIVTIVLCATLIYELIGPIITKIALIKAGEIHVIKHKKHKMFFSIYHKKINIK